MRCVVANALAAALVAAALAGGPAGGAASGTAPVKLVSPGPIAAGPDRTLWVGDRYGIVRVTTEGQMARMAKIRYVWELARGPDRAIWFVADGRLGRITTAGDVTYVDALTRRANDVAAGADGNMWVTEGTLGQPGQIARVTPAGAVTEFSDGLAQGAEPYSITRGPDGNMWFADSERNEVGRVTPTGQIETRRVVAPDDEVAVGDITAGPDGALWFVVDDAIGRITTSWHVRYYGHSFVWAERIAAGRDGNLWVTGAEHDSDTATVGRITPAGDVKVFGRGFSGLYTHGVTRGPNGIVWVTENGRTGGHVVQVSKRGIAHEFPSKRPPCRVPDMRRYTLPWVRAALFNALCALDPASERAGGHNRIVVRTDPPAGAVRPYGTRVKVTWAPREPLPKDCKLPGYARRVLRTDRVLLFAFKDYLGDGYTTRTTHAACIRPHGAAHRVTDVVHGDLTYYAVGHFRASGDFVGYRYFEEDHYGSSYTDLRVYDVGGARTLYSMGIRSVAGDDPYPTEHLGGYALSPHAALAWLMHQPAGGEVLRAYGKGGQRTLDSGDLANLRFDGDTLHWTNAGVEETAVVEAPQEAG